MFPCDGQLHVGSQKVSLLYKPIQSEILKSEHIRNWSAFERSIVKPSCLARCSFTAYSTDPVLGTNDTLRAIHSDSSPAFVASNTETSSTSKQPSLQTGSEDKNVFQSVQKTDVHGVVTNHKVSRRVMCLMSDTGGGHRASAQALKDCFTLTYGEEFTVDIIDLWSSNSPWPFCNMPKSYFFLVKHPWLWRLNFRCSEPKLIHEFMFKGYTAIVAKSFSEAFKKINPHLVISVHPLMQHVPINVLQQMQKLYKTPKVPFATVVTDLTRCHATWFHRGVDKCFVATNLVARQALKLGLNASQIICHGLPIRPSFSAPKRLSKHALRDKLNLDTSASTVMIVGGGEGMGKLEEIATALAQERGSCQQVVVICGRNTRLSESLLSRTWPFKMHVKGFVNNMSEYMAACDCVVSKAGPGTIAEAMICGVPVLLNGCIPCQEEGNIPFVINNRVGGYSEQPKIIASIISSWLAPENASELQLMSHRAMALGRPEATFHIVRDLAVFCKLK